MTGRFWLGCGPCSRPELSQQRLHRRPAAFLGGGQQVRPVAHPADKAPLWQTQTPQQIRFVQMALRDLLIVEILDPYQPLEPLRPVDWRPAPNRFDVLDVQPTRFLAAVAVVRQQLERRPAGLTAFLARRLRQLPVSTPEAAAAAVVLGHVVAGSSVIHDIDRVLVERPQRPPAGLRALRQHHHP